MSLEAIIQHILIEADKEKQKIMQQAMLQAQEIIRQAREEADDLYRGIINTQAGFEEKQKQKLIVNARLEAKKNLLIAKQELINAVFDRLKSGLNKTQLKKQQISQDKTQEAYEGIDFYLNKMRQDYEIKIAEILFE